MNSEAKVFATHLLHFLACGERIAVTCASGQAKLATDNKMRRFFLTQARQEKQHAIVFSTASQWLKPKNFQPIKNTGLVQFEKKIIQAVSQNHFAESIIAQQLLFEGLGEITLEKVSQGIEDRGFRFQRIRKIILKQEKAHHQFGQRHFQKILNDPAINMQNIAKQCKDYLEILQQVLTEMEPILQYYNQNSRVFYTQLIKQLPTELCSEP